MEWIFIFTLCGFLGTLLALFGSDGTENGPGLAGKRFEEISRQSFIKGSSPEVICNNLGDSAGSIGAAMLTTI